MLEYVEILILIHKEVQVPKQTDLYEKTETSGGRNRGVRTVVQEEVVKEHTRYFHYALF